jgi:hypothetical protein
MDLEEAEAELGTAKPAIAAKMATEGTKVRSL